MSKHDWEQSKNNKVLSKQEKKGGGLIYGTETGKLSFPLVLRTRQTLDDRENIYL